MISCELKLFVPFFLSTLFFSNVESKNFDIFSIVDENVLQRKTQYIIKNINSTNLESQYPYIKNGEKVLRYLSLEIDEINEVNKVELHKFNEDPVELQSAYIELSDEIMFHGISFDDFTNFKKAPVKMETIIPDGSDENTVNIVYESKINKMVMSGLAKINGTDYNFFLNISDLTLREEYERTPALEGKIVTKSILETLNFKTFTMVIVLKDEKKFIRSPNRPISRQLADSWLVTVINVINKRFVRPRITEQSQSYFKNYKNAFLASLCSPILIMGENSKPFSQFEDKNLLNEDSDVYDKYSFRNITFDTLSFTKCKSKSVTVEIEEDSSEKNAGYLHNLFFIFTYSSSKMSQHSFFKWTFQKSRQGGSKDGYYRRQYETPEEQCSTRIKYWSVNLKIITDKYGHKANDSSPVIDVDIKLENYGSKKFHNLTNKFLEPFKKGMAASLETYFDQMLIIKKITDFPARDFVSSLPSDSFRSQEYRTMKRTKHPSPSMTRYEFDLLNSIRDTDRIPVLRENPIADIDDDDSKDEKENEDP